MGLNPSPFEYLTFNGKNSAEFGVWISGGGTYNAPARDVEMVSVPGRNGDISYDNGRFQNVAVTYPAFISRKTFPIKCLDWTCCSRDCGRNIGGSPKTEEKK